MLAGELAMSTIPQPERVLPEDQLLNSRSRQSGSNKVCLSISQELQNLLWVMTGENTALVLSRRINTSSIVGLQPAEVAPEVAEASPVEQPAAPRPLPSLDNLDPAWNSLIERLASDGFDKKEMQLLFAGLGKKSFSPAFMAAKVR